MPIRAITSKQAAFLDILANRGFGDDKIGLIINNPGLVDDISNLLISKATLPSPSIFKDDEWPLGMDGNDYIPFCGRDKSDGALVSD